MVDAVPAEAIGNEVPTSSSSSKAQVGSKDISKNGEVRHGSGSGMNGHSDMSVQRSPPSSLYSAPSSGAASAPQSLSVAGPSNGAVSKHTSQTKQPSPLRNSSPPDYSMPLQVKPLKAPHSPLLYQGALERKSPRSGGKGSPLNVQRKPLPLDARGEGDELALASGSTATSTAMSTLSPRSERVRPLQQAPSHQRRQEDGVSVLTGKTTSMTINGNHRTRKGAAVPSGPDSPSSMSKTASRGMVAPVTSYAGMRIRKGQKLEDIQAAQSQPLPPLSHIDSPFQVQEYIALLVQQNPHDVNRIVALPHASHSSAAINGEDDGSFGDKSKNGDDAVAGAEQLGSESFMGIDDEPAQTVDTDIWIFEQLRRLVLDFTSPWLTSLQRECDRSQRPETCHAMNAEEWMYLCASHGEEKQCCAIDYVIHTLDGTTALLNSHRHFPSRTYVPTTSVRHFGSVSRRLSRIFVHAHEHHRDVFEACEAETSLYSRFLALIETYDLIPIEALPRLAHAANELSPVTAGDKPKLDGAHSIEGGSIEGRTRIQDDFDARDRSGKGKHSLFDAGPMVHKEEDDDDDGGDDEEQEEERNAVNAVPLLNENGDKSATSAKKSVRQEEESENVTDHERVDSQASRITAIARESQIDPSALEREARADEEEEKTKGNAEEIDVSASS